MKGGAIYTGSIFLIRQIMKESSEVHNILSLKAIDNAMSNCKVVSLQAVRESTLMSHNKSKHAPQLTTDELGVLPDADSSFCVNFNYHR
jgi:hypothetical protein